MANKIAPWKKRKRWNSKSAHRVHSISFRVFVRQIRNVSARKKATKSSETYVRCAVKRRLEWREKKIKHKFRFEKRRRKHMNANLSELILWIIRFNITSLAYKVPNILRSLNAQNQYTAKMHAFTAVERSESPGPITTFQMTADMYLHTCPSPSFAPHSRVKLLRVA